MGETFDPPTLLHLPAELILNILGYLHPIDLTDVARTCKALHLHSYDDLLWQPLINRNLPNPITRSTPFRTFRELYAAHHPYWFLPRQRIWFSDYQPTGKLLVSQYEPHTGCISAYTVTAKRGPHALNFWERDRNVIIHSFHPVVSLDLARPVVRLSADSPYTADHSNSDEQHSHSSFGKEVMMDTNIEPGFYSAFRLCRTLPQAAIGDNTHVWPPLRFPAKTRTRNQSGDDFNSSGHHPKNLAEISEHNFRVRKWVEFTGREWNGGGASPSGPASTLAATLGRIASRFSTSGVHFRLPQDITTYASLPETCYTPTPAKPWQGIWCGDYSGHGCEFLLVTQPDKAHDKPLPRGMNWLQPWFDGTSAGRRGSASRLVNYEDELGFHAEPVDDDESEDESSNPNGLNGQNGSSTHADRHATDYPDAPTGRLEAIKLTGDPNIPRGEYTFIAPDIGHGGFLRIADEALFRGARVVRCAGHIAEAEFVYDSYTPSQMIMISHDTLAQYWERMGHISYYRRVDLDALVNYRESTSWAEGCE